MRTSRKALWSRTSFDGRPRREGSAPVRWPTMRRTARCTCVKVFWRSATASPSSLTRGPSNVMRSWFFSMPSSVIGLDTKMTVYTGPIVPSSFHMCSYRLRFARLRSTRKDAVDRARGGRG